MTPADELRGAAALLRETAARATRGPWNASAVWSSRSCSTSAVYSYAYPTGTAASEVIPSMKATKTRPLVRPGDAEWIALMSPDVAGLLARWLEYVALDHEIGAGRGITAISPSNPALVFARAIKPAEAEEATTDD